MDRPPPDSALPLAPDAARSGSQTDVTLERERLSRLEMRNDALVAEIAGHERARAEAEARLRFATKAGRLGIWELDLQTGELTASALCRDNFGRDPRAPFTYADLRAAVHPDDRAAVHAAIERSVEDGVDYDVEYRVIRPERETGWVQVRAQVLRDAVGKPVRMAGISLDITARKQAEVALGDTGALLRTIIETGPNLIYAKDIQGRMRLANGPLLAFVGKTWSELEGRTDAEYMDDPAQAAAVMANDRRIIAANRTEAFEEPVDSPEGETRVWLSTKAPTRDADGLVTGVVGVSVDITARKQAEEALRRLAETLERRVAERTRERDRIWRNSQDLLLVADGTGVVRSINPAWTTLLGYTPEELIDRPLDGLVHPDDVDRTAAAIAHAAVRKLAHFENRFRHRDGTYCWFSWTATPDEGLIYGNGRNIMAEKEQEAALRHAEEALRQSQKMEAVGQLTGGLAHDFNNLLTGIVGSLELLQTRAAQGRVQELGRYIDAARGAADRAASLTHRLLAFSRRQTLDPKPIAANRLIGGMEDLIRRTLGPAVKLEAIKAVGLWTTLCDPNQLENALLNLCINGRDAMPDGGRLTIETENAHLTAAAARTLDLAPGQYVALYVTDTGVGIPPEVIARAFDPFFTTKPLGQGTGLGLSMIYGFARQSGGHVRLHSEVGQGTTVKLYLPRHHGADADEAAAAGTDASPGALSRETVLVVDDEPTIRMLIADILDDLGYNGIEAADGASAMPILNSDTRVDLLLTDVGLPGGMNGRQLADAARVRRPELRVLFVTGYAENAVFGNGMLEPGMQLMTKPFSLETMAARIRAMLASR